MSDLCDDVEAVLETFMARSSDDFALLEYWFDDVLEKHRLPPDGFDPDLIANLVYNGWFVFAVQRLIPKLHRYRCVVDLSRWNAVRCARSWQQRHRAGGNVHATDRTDLHEGADHQSGTDRESQTSRAELELEAWLDRGGIRYSPFARQIRKVDRGKVRYAIQTTTRLRPLLEKVHAFHPDSWLEPRLINSLCQLAEQSVMIRGTPVRALGWELIDTDTGEPIAGDVGFQSGRTYSSMTGFSNRRYPSVGIVQLMAQATLLRDRDFRLWDLGMLIPYKIDLGAQPVARHHFIDLIRHHRRHKLALHVPVTPVQRLSDFHRLIELARAKDGKDRDGSKRRTSSG